MTLNYSFFAKRRNTLTVKRREKKCFDVPKYNYLTIISIFSFKTKGCVGKGGERALLPLKQHHAPTINYRTTSHAHAHIPIEPKDIINNTDNTYTFFTFFCSSVEVK